MATTRNNGMLTAANSAAIRNFKDRVARTIHHTCVGTINDVMTVGLQKMVNEAGFNDYTGKLINSYQAAAISAGGIESRLARTGAKVTHLGDVIEQRGFHSKAVSYSKIPIFRTSFGMPGTTQISHRGEYVEINGKRKFAFRMRNRRDSGESPELRKAGYIDGKREKSFNHGFGDDITKLKGIAAPFSHGYWIVFTNGHPLANIVHTQHAMGGMNGMQFKHAVQHKVFPDGGLDVNKFAIANKHMKTAIARAKRR